MRDCGPFSRLWVTLGGSAGCRLDEPAVSSLPRLQFMRILFCVATQARTGRPRRGATGHTVVLVSPLSRALETALLMFNGAPGVFTLHVIPELVEFNSRQGVCVCFALSVWVPLGRGCNVRAWGRNLLEIHHH